MMTVVTQSQSPTESSRMTRVVSESTLTTIIEYDESPKFLDYPKIAFSRLSPSKSPNKTFAKMIEGYNSDEEKDEDWENQHLETRLHLKFSSRLDLD